MEYKGSRMWSPATTNADLTPPAPFEVVPCDVFITEATFALPVFRHPDDRGEIAKLLTSVARNPDRTHLVGVYALGKAQRVMSLLRAAGCDQPIYVHGALAGLSEFYHAFGIDLGELRNVTPDNKQDLSGAIVLAPPGATNVDGLAGLPIPWCRSVWLDAYSPAARQRGVELPLILSDHADWDELADTIEAVGAAEIWVTHGREDALVHYAGTRYPRPRAFHARL